MRCGPCSWQALLLRRQEVPAERLVPRCSSLYILGLALQPSAPQEGGRVTERAGNHKAFSLLQRSRAWMYSSVLYIFVICAAHLPVVHDRARARSSHPVLVATWDCW